MLLIKLDYLLSGLFFLIALFFIVNSKADITGAVIGVQFTSALSSIFGIIFFILAIFFLKYKV